VDRRIRTDQPGTERAPQPPPSRDTRRLGLALLGILLTALNLRAAITAVSPLVGDIRTDLGIGRAAAGLLTTVPVVCFGLLSPVAVLLGRRLGTERALLLGMVGVAAGSAVRAVPGLALTFAGTALIGASITIGNVLLPTVVKREYGARSGAVTGLYTAMMTAGAALAAAVSAPLSGAFGGWRPALLVWAAPALLAGLAWLPKIREHTRVPEPASATRVRGSSVTWALVVFMSLQAGVFYALLAWLPAILREGGAPAGGANLALSLYNLVGIPGALAAPLLAARRPAQLRVAVPIGVGWVIMLVGLLALPHLYLLWASVGGLVQGAGIGLLFILFVLRTSDQRTARALSGTVQTIGYLVGSTGPFLLGALRDATGGWTVPLVVLLAAVAIMSTGMLWSARDQLVG
jgi:MFS transporter, CP family, cyanate transporter